MRAAAQLKGCGACRRPLLLGESFGGYHRPCLDRLLPSLRTKGQP